MTGVIRFLANSLWLGLNLPGSLAFHLARADVAGAQRRLLLRLLRQNADTEWGRRYGFAGIRSPAEYQARVPLSVYDDYLSALDRVAAGRPAVLTRAPVLLLEQTSGSTAPTKTIPYTAGLKAEFGRAIAPWIVDLYGHHPGLLAGQAYWSITPVTRRGERTPGGIPIGFEEDAEYFGPLQRYLVGAVMAVPPLVRLIDDMETFRYVTLLFLLRCRSLALISIWNPTFLTLLVSRLDRWWPALADDIARGSICGNGIRSNGINSIRSNGINSIRSNGIPMPLGGNGIGMPLPPDLAAALARSNRPDPGRAAQIRAIFEAETDPGARHARLWPRLLVISLWTDAQAGLYAPEVARLFPQARLLGKGLLATEGFVSLPLVGRAGAALAVRSHFFEFLPGGENSAAPCLAHELESGGCYEVVLTTGGGLYRYRLHDLVEVTGHLGQCPLLRFVGKAAHVSDWFGEKLNEQHVRAALEPLLAGLGIWPAFVMVACEPELAPPAYALFVEAGPAADDTLRELGEALEAALRQNYHYDYSRDLGQLAALRVYRVKAGGLEAYLAACQARGQRAGDVKPAVLHHQGGWSEVFRGRWL